MGAGKGTGFVTCSVSWQGAEHMLNGIAVLHRTMGSKAMQVSRPKKTGRTLRGRRGGKKQPPQDVTEIQSAMAPGNCKLLYK